MSVQRSVAEYLDIMDEIYEARLYVYFKNLGYPDDQADQYAKDAMNHLRDAWERWMEGSPTLAEAVKTVMLPFPSYRYHDSQEKQLVDEYLERYPFLNDILAEAYEHIQHYFPNTPIYLEVATDPEGSRQQLWVQIKTALDVATAHDLLNKLDDAWWLNTLKHAQGKLGITVIFL